MSRHGFTLALFNAIPLLLVCASPTSAQATYEVITDFSNTNAFTPGAALVRASDGNYYGTTYSGGDFGYGTVFRMTPEGIVSVLHSFTGIDGSLPYAPLVEGSDGSLYGTTAEGGAAGIGTIFKITTQGSFTHLHAIAGLDEALGCHPEGFFPSAPLVEGSDGRFYSTLNSGDSCSGHFIFRISTTGIYDLLPIGPVGGSLSGLTRGTDGYLYGATYGDGISAFGHLFRITETGEFALLHAFLASEGFFPIGELIQASDGLFYGTTRVGGGGYPESCSGGCGAVFRFDPVTLTHTTLHSFTATGDAGVDPYAGLVEGSDGWLYGTTHSGGAQGGGALFRISPSTGQVETLHAFESATGFDPRGELIQSSPGVLLGTAAFGGSDANRGVVFRLTLGSATTTSLAVSSNSPVFGQAVTLTATVGAASGTPTGEVQFFDGAVLLGTATLNTGVAGLTTTTLSVGTHGIRAEYLGEGSFLPSTTAAVSITVGRSQTTTTLGSSPNPSTRKQPVTITATVTATLPGAGVASGEVQLFEGKKRLGTATLVNGAATFQLVFAGMGQHVVTATYPGDSNFMGSTAAPLTQTVTK